MVGLKMVALPPLRGNPTRKRGTERATLRLRVGSALTRRVTNLLEIVARLAGFATIGSQISAM